MDKKKLRPFGIWCGLAVVMAAALLLGGCAAVGPDYKKPSTSMPDKWAMAHDPALKPSDADVRQWWTVFDDPLLTRLINETGKNNLDLKVALAKIRELRAQIGVVRGAELPSLDASGSVVNQRSSENVGTMGGGVTDSYYTTGLNASWEIDLFGRIRRNIEAAYGDYQASQEDRNDIMISLFAELATAYYTLRTSQAQIMSINKNIESQSGVLKLTKTLFDNGLTTGLAVSQAEYLLASSQSQLPPLKDSVNQSLNSIALLTGRRPGYLMDELRKRKPLPDPPAEVAVGVPAELLRRRPDIRRAERQLAAANARIGVATADLYPTFSITGSLGLSALDSSKLFRASSQYFSIGPGFTWNLFAGGSIRAQIKVQDYQMEQALHTYEKSVLSALRDVENAFSAYTNQRTRVAALERTVKAAQKTFKLALELYRQGLSDFQNVLDAQKTLFDYDNQLASARGNTISYLVALYKAMGGGWTPVVKKPGEKEKKTDESKKAGVEPAKARQVSLK